VSCPKASRAARKAALKKMKDQAHCTITSGQTLTMTRCRPPREACARYARRRRRADRRPLVRPPTPRSRGMRMGMVHDRRRSRRSPAGSSEGRQQSRQPPAEDGSCRPADATGSTTTPPPGGLIGPTTTPPAEDGSCRPSDGAAWRIEPRCPEEDGSCHPASGSPRRRPECRLGWWCRPEE